MDQPRTNEPQPAPKAKKRPIAFHPLLLAAYPALAIFSENVSLLPLGGAIRAALVFMACVAALWGLLSLALRDHRRGALLASLVTSCFFTYQFFLKSWLRSDWLPSMVGGEDAFRYVLGAAGLGLAIAFARRGRHTTPLTRFLNVACSILLAWPLFAIASSLYEIRSHASGSRDTTAAALRYQGRPPDIFYVVLDGYGRADVIERDFGYSNSEFLGELRKRGFVIAEQARSNYSQTDLSVSSSLNSEFVQDLVEPLGNASAERALADERIDKNATIEALRPLGYRFIAITTGAPSIRFASADQALEATNGERLYWEAIWSWTPFPPTHVITSDYSQRRRELLYSGFETLSASAAPVAAPRFVFAHILAPHPSFVVDETGRLHPRGPAGLWDANDFIKYGGTPESYRDGYVAQLKFVNRRLLEAIDEVLKHDSPKPIVILQGDHGPRLDFHHDDFSKVNPKQAFPILFAVHGPKNLQEAIHSDITPVNLFRVVFNTVFRAQRPLLPDRSFYSEWSNPLEFYEMTKRLAPGVDGNPRAAEP